MDDNEIEALSAIFCLPGEFSMFDNEMTFNVMVDLKDSPNEECSCKVPVKLILTFGGEYPNKIPDISIFCEQLNRDTISKIKDTAVQACADLLGEPMIMPLVSTIQECLPDEIQHCRRSSELHSEETPVIGGCAGDDTLWTYILHIDHMRSKTKYCRTLERWAGDLCLGGRILFHKKLILVLLQGCLGNIKEFIVRLKTVSIDVDSRGHSCKERMMTVLCEHKHTSSQASRFTDFAVCELSSESEAKTMFDGVDLTDMYREHISKLL